jgi:DNA invertase Pin-like site-specific DNA recombinase
MTRRPLERKIIKRVIELRLEYFPIRLTAQRLKINHQSVKNIMNKYNEGIYNDIKEELQTERPELFEA